MTKPKFAKGTFVVVKEPLIIFQVDKKEYTGIAGEVLAFLVVTHEENRVAVFFPGMEDWLYIKEKHLMAVTSEENPEYFI
jgi:hypothetical protein